MKIFLTDHPEADKTRQLLQTLLAERLGPPARQWMEQQTAKLRSQYTERSLFLAFSSAFRWAGKTPLALTAEEKVRVQQCRPGSTLEGWTLEELLRAYWLLLIPGEPENSYLSTLDKIFETADVSEASAAYKSLQFLPKPESLVKRAAEGVRTNMTVLLDAISLCNPYPADFMPEPSWNQLVMKAIFTERPLYQLYGADQRANQDLAGMLLGFAHERWAAGRYVIPELWRFAGPYLNETFQPALDRIGQKGTDFEKTAALLACRQSNWSGARLWTETQEASGFRPLASDWDTLGVRYQESLPVPQGHYYQQAGSGISGPPKSPA
jgi:hypothetical protein